MRKGDAPVDLQELIQAVEDETQSCTELQRLDVAVKYGELLKGIGDDLVGHFVDQAREGGATWAQVGERLGVTKQAAHQRHLRARWQFGRSGHRRPGAGPMQRFTEDARRVVVAAQDEARRLKHNYVGAEHLLLGLSADEGVGPLLTDAGAPKDAILEQIRTIVGEGEDAPPGAIPFTPRSKRALESAARAAGGSGRIVPAHVLIGILELDEGVGADVLDVLKVSRADLRSRAEEIAPPA